jgi:hypothetical protein
MKKLLGILGTITIAGSGMAGLVGNAPAKIKENNNLQNLIRVKRGNENILRVKAKALAPDYLYAKISHDTWTNIAYQHDVKNLQEFKNSLFLTLNNFPKINESWQVGVDWDEMGAGDIAIIRNVITDHFDRINTVFKNNNNKNKPWFLLNK